MKIELTDRQVNNLLTFLHRVQLTGHEAMEFVSIVNTINMQKNNNIVKPAQKQKEAG